VKDDLSSSQAYSEQVIYPEVRRQQNAHALDCRKRAAHLIRKAITMLEHGDAPVLAEQLKPYADEALKLSLPPLRIKA
jgi:hypothetical protein